MNYGLMTYNFKDHFNLGDYIQSLAARQFLPRVDAYVEREKLGAYAGPQIKMIMNGWYMRNAQYWPPSPDIIPLLVSFHLNTRCADKMLSGAGLEYFAKHGPVGCRDVTTLEMLSAKGIEAYFSSCLTLTLGNTFRHTGGRDVYLVDVLFKYPTLKSIFKSLNSFRKSFTSGKFFLVGKRQKRIRDIFGAAFFENAKEVTHHYPSQPFATEASRFELAERTLRLYEKAKVVITSRIHCALPCLAMGTPVIFVHGGFEKPTEQCRLEGVYELFNMVKVSKSGQVECNFDLNEFLRSGRLPERNEYRQYLERLNQTCKAFIENVEQ